MGLDLPFLGILFDDTPVDFEGFLDKNKPFASLGYLEESGRSGEAPVSANSHIRCNFKEGDAKIIEETLLTCDVFNKNCY